MVINLKIFNMKKYLSLLICCIILSSCDPSQKAYNDLLSFTENIENNGASFTNEDWENAEYEYSAIVDAIDAQYYTDEQLVEIGRLKGRCAVQFTKHSIDNANNEFDDLLLEAEGFIEAIMEGLSN